MHRKGVCGDGRGEDLCTGDGCRVGDRDPSSEWDGDRDGKGNGDPMTGRDGEVRGQDGRQGARQSSVWRVKVDAAGEKVRVLWDQVTDESLSGVGRTSVRDDDGVGDGIVRDERCGVGSVFEDVQVDDGRNGGVLTDGIVVVIGVRSDRGDDSGVGEGTAGGGIDRVPKAQVSV